MNALHFCSYYVGSKVYRELFFALSKLESVKQTVYVPVRDNSHKGSNELYEGNINFYYTTILSKLTKVFLLVKIILVSIVAFNKFRTENFHVIHAHTLYSDGIPAFLFSRFFKKKLVLTIRNTDVNIGFKYYRHYKWLARRALSFSSKIIFISPAHKVKFQDYFGNSYDEKLFIVPNGIDDFYIEHIKLFKKTIIDKKVALHVASIDRNKNLKNTIIAFFEATKQYENSEFRIAGGNYFDYQNIFGDLPANLKSKVVFLGRLDKNQLIEEMNNASIFIMVSHKETFGLVYMEAISQCLPIIFTCGEGIDGYFKNGKYGFKATADITESISVAISNALDKFPAGLGPFITNPAQLFSWDIIADNYFSEIYR